MRRPQGLWAERDFLKLWAGQTVSAVGTEITLLAVPLAAILVLDASALQVALIGTVAMLPFLLFALPAGVWIDRLPKRPILVVTDFGRAAALVSIPLAYAFDALTLPHLYAVAFVNGCLAVFFDVAYLAYLPALVRRHRLPEANGKMEATRSAAHMAGPGIGGVLVGAFTAPVAILADAVSFALSGLLVWRIRAPDERPERRPRSARALWGELREGLAYVFRQPYLRVLTLTTGSWNLFSHIGFGVYLVYLVRRLELSPAVVGALITAGQAGAVAAAAFSERITRRFGLGRTIAWSAVVGSAAFLLVPLAPPSAPHGAVVASMLLFSFFGMLFNVNQLSFRQSITPAALMGRMNSVVRFMYWGPMPAGYAIGGVLASQIGLRRTLFVSAVGATLVMTPLLFHRIRTLEAMPAPDDGEPPPAVVPAVADA